LHLVAVRPAPLLPKRVCTADVKDMHGTRYRAHHGFEYPKPPRAQAV
jgi:hypothetical protein